GRKLVVCIDGTSNQFGQKNTNVIEIYSQVCKDPKDNQLTYYNSGIGTFAEPSWKSLRYLGQVLDHKIDLAIAWNFEQIVMNAYRWLVADYEPGDVIYLFGFSRGAYQVRVLAGMIEKVGLIHKGNEEQIPFAYELYANPKRNDPSTLAGRFRRTFSRKNVKVHFVGVWDTVSSIGIVREKNLPFTITLDHICYFRHALALDERRVKFLPEYARGGVMVPSNSKEPRTENDVKLAPKVKEVWFSGTHSDIRSPSSIWMSYEAISAGLQLDMDDTIVEWNWDKLGEVRESLKGVWHILKWLPLKRLAYKDEETPTWR
ncbi:hypothetical protein SERLA73DRAFT_47031, partial [Serpula lacrymans var. lacrymans S7.3]